jgi:hypothetical protein
MTEMSNRLSTRDPGLDEILGDEVTAHSFNLMRVAPGKRPRVFRNGAG